MADPGSDQVSAPHLALLIFPTQVFYALQVINCVFTTRSTGARWYCFQLSVCLSEAALFLI